ncbi:MAG TPA: TadE family type IV pilus minor pilin [Mycobacteriales bacterium]|nr:TadE family type IV pilus minor pilin [Mycobacteriales bacterium]
MTARPGRVERVTAGPTADEGMVTAELAVALPTVVVVLLAAVTAVAAVGTQLRCTDAAASAARLLARGEPAAVARTAADAVVGGAPEIRISTAAGEVSVIVRAPVRFPLLGRLLPLPAVAAEFRQPLEPGVRP